MRNLASFVLVFALSVAAVAAQANGFTGKWEGTFTPQRADGTEGNPNQVVFNLKQNGKQLTGTAGPPSQQWEIANGAVDAGKATFQVQQPNGPLFTFTLAVVKERLQGDMAVEVDGERRRAKVDAARAK